MLKCVKSPENNGLIVGKLYKCYGLAGAGYYVIHDESGELVAYLSDYFEKNSDGTFKSYDPNGNEIK